MSQVLGQFLTMNSPFKRSFSHNDLSLFNQDTALSMSRSQSYRGKIRFSKNIENICIFKKTDSPSRIASSRRYSISDFKKWTIYDSNFDYRLGFFGNHICLGSLSITFGIFGIVLVKNLSFEKTVTVRYSWDDWKSFQDLDCTFSKSISNSFGSFTGIDEFVFTLDLDPLVKFREKLSFCLRYTVNGSDYWDNNKGQNYQVILFFIKLNLQVYLTREKSPTPSDSESEFESLLESPLESPKFSIYYKSFQTSFGSYF